MLSIRNNEIYITRGDSAYIQVELIDDNGAVYTPVSGDKLYFRLKKSIFGNALLLMKTINTQNMTLELTPNDTSSLEFTSYRYEIELVTVDGNHFTVVHDKPFFVGVELES